MLFAKVLLALPFIGAAFAAPTFELGVKTNGLGQLGGVLGSVLGGHKNLLTAGKADCGCKKKVNILSIVTDLKSSITASVSTITKTSTKVEVEACLNSVIKAFDTCQAALSLESRGGLGITLAGISLDLGLFTKPQLVKSVGGVLAEIVQLVDGLVLNISAEIRGGSNCSGLLAQLNPCLSLLISTCESLLGGVSLCVGKILAGLKYTLCPILCPINGLLGGLLRCVFA